MLCGARWFKSGMKLKAKEEMPFTVPDDWLINHFANDYNGRSDFTTFVAGTKEFRTCGESDHFVQIDHLFRSRAKVKGLPKGPAAKAEQAASRRDKQRRGIDPSAAKSHTARTA